MSSTFSEADKGMLQDVATVTKCTVVIAGREDGSMYAFVDDDYAHIALDILRITLESAIEKIEARG